MPTRAEINREVAAAARRHGVDPNLFAGLVRQESGFNPNALSPAGAIGLAQLMPKTAAGLGVDPHDWKQNLDGGARYLQNAMRINKGNLQRVLASYNAGQGAVNKYGGIPPYAETRAYVPRVLAYMREFKQAGFDKLGAPLTAATPPKTAPLAATLPAPGGEGLQTPDPIARQGFLQNIIDQNAKLAGISSVSVPMRAQPAPLPQQQTITQPTTGPKKLPDGTKVQLGSQAANPAVQAALQDAMEMQGTPYSWGGGTPAGPGYGSGRGAKTKGFDCSSLVQYMAAKAGVSISRTTYSQIKEGAPVARGQLQPGDQIFFGSAKDPHHTGIYVGNGKFLHAPSTGDVVKVSSLGSRSDYVTARRHW